MHGIVSLLDDEHYALVEDIWAQLEKEFGVHGLYTTPFPHFSYQVAGGYDVEAVGDYLQELTQNMRPFPDPEPLRPRSLHPLQAGFVHSDCA